MPSKTPNKKAVETTQSKKVAGTKSIKGRVTVNKTIKGKVGFNRPSAKQIIN